MAPSVSAAPGTSTSSAVASSSSVPFAPPSNPTRPPVGGRVSLYAASSQHRNWSLSAQELASRRQSAWSEARARLEESWKREEALSSDTQSPTQYPDVDSLSLLTRFYLVKQRTLVLALKLPDCVDEVAASYVKRFYVDRSELEWHPKGVMLTCVYLACKSTSYAMPLSAYAARLSGKEPKRKDVEENEALVRGLEFQVADAMGWELATHRVGDALKGLFWDAQMLKPSPTTLLQTLLPRAQALLLSSRLTDVELTHTPAHIALACLWASGDGAPALVERWLDSKEELARAEREARVAALRAWREKDRKERERLKALVKKGSEEAKLFDEVNGEAYDAEDTGPGTASDPLGMPRSMLRSIIKAIVAAIEVQEAASKAAAVKAAAGTVPGARPAPPPIVDKEEATRIDGLLKACSDPSKSSGSALYNKRKADAESEAASKRAKKAAAAAIKDPFGESGNSRGLAPSASTTASKGAASSGGGLFGKEIERRAKVAAATDDQAKGRKEGAAEEVDSDDDVPLAPDLLRAEDTEA